MDPTQMGAGHQGGAPEPQRSLIMEPNQQTYQAPNADDLQPGIPLDRDLQYSPPPANPDLAATVEELKGNYGRAINALSERNQAIDDMNLRMAEVQLELEALRASQGMAHPSNNLNLPEGVDPAAGATINDLFQFGKNVAQIVEQRLAEATAQQIRASWNVTPQEEQMVIQRFPSYANLPEPQRSQQIKRAVDLLIRPSQPKQQPAAAQPARSPEAPAPVQQRIVPHVERSYSPVDETVKGSAMTEALAAYNAIKMDTKLTPSQRASALRAAAERIQSMTGQSFEDTMKTDWVSRG